MVRLEPKELVMGVERIEPQKGDAVLCRDGVWRLFPLLGV